MCHYDFAYRGPGTGFANLAPNCSFWKNTLALYPVLLFFMTKVFMHNSSDMNPVSEHMEHDSTLSAFTKEIGKQSGFTILFSDRLYLM